MKTQLGKISRDEFEQKVREWCERKSTPNRVIEVVLKRNDWCRKNFFYTFRCASCDKCHEGAGWRGSAQYAPETGEMVVQTNSVVCRGDFQRRYGQRSGGLTSEQKACVAQCRPPLGSESQICAPGLSKFLFSIPLDFPQSWSEGRSIS